MKSKITFRLFQIDKGLPDEIIEDYLSLEADDIDPIFYRLVWESLEDPDLEKLYSKYNTDDRPNSHVCRTISVSDIIEIQDEHGISTFYISDLFDWTEITFDKSQVPPEMGFQNWIVNMDSERRRNLSMNINAKAAIQIMVPRLGKSKKTVTAMFNKSKTYQKLHDDKTGLWAESPFLIVDAFEKEIKETS